jgi:eukaryotic-like serine/threonine-protein kinase
MRGSIMPLQSGTRLGPYEVLFPLGAGGMGEVWLATELRLGRKVALKLLPTDLTRDPDRIQRFEQEARAASALNHPNVCTIHALGETSEGQHYIAMEYVEGETLRQRLASAPLSLREALDIAIQVAAALSVAHAAGIVHRDIKPENVMLRPDGVVKVLDFGLAKLAPVVGGGADTTQMGVNTDAGIVVGTAAYMSPEQARGQQVDARTDIWSLGVMLYEMLAGRSPFAGPSGSDVLVGILQNDPAPLSRFDAAAPAELQRIVGKALRKDKEQRYQGIKDLLLDLQSLRDSLHVPATTSASAAEVALPRTPALPVQSRLRQFVWLIPIGAIAVVVWIYLHQSRQSEPPAPVTVVPFTTFPGLEGAPTFSPDGSQIAFAWSQEGHEDTSDLYVKVIGSEKTLRLTTQTEGGVIPSWSPDGRQIAFARAAPKRSGIFVVPALGGTERKLADVEYSFWLEMLFSWSPDGTLLAYSDTTRTEENQGIRSSVHGVERRNVVLLNTATLDKRALPNPSDDCVWSLVPAFAPDGRSLAVACTVAIDLNDLYIVPVSGGTARRVTRVEGEFSGMVWTADGKSLVFGSNGDLWRVAVAGGARQKVVASRDAGALAISRDGRRLAFDQGVENVNLWQVRLAATTRPEGLPLKVISSSRRQRNAVFSPDGRRVAFDSNRSGANEIWVSDADGSNASALTSFGGPLTGSPDWSPDGRYIAFDSKSGGRSGLYVVSAEGGPVRQVQTGLAASAVPKWSADGRYLHFAGYVAGRDQVFRVPAQGGKAVAITHAGGHDPRVSRDGARIYHVKDGAIWWTPTAGGQETRIGGMPQIEPWFSTAWALAASGVYFINPKKPASIDFLDFASERVIRVVELPGKPAQWAGLALSHDGRRLLYSQVDASAGDVMLIDNFQ